MNRHYPYKTLTQLKTRDVALCSTILLSGVRASEAALKRKQFIDLEDRIVLLNVKTKKRGNMRHEIIFPKSGLLKEFTVNVSNWLRQIPDEESFVFPHGSYCGISWNIPLHRNRIRAIVTFKTGKFPHWLRGVHETYYGEHVFEGNAWKLAEHMGLKRLDSTRPYVQSNIRKSIEERLFK